MYYLLKDLAIVMMYEDIVFWCLILLDIGYCVYIVWILYSRYCTGYCVDIGNIDMRTTRVIYSLTNP